MKDRNVEFPNRYRLVKVEGTDDIYDLTPAPGTVTEEGTFLNVENLLKDTTAALLGGDSSMTPDDALMVLKGLIDSISPDTIGTARVEMGSYTGTDKYGSGNKNTLAFSFTPKFVIVRGNDYSSYGYVIEQMVMFYGQTAHTIPDLYANTTTGRISTVTWSGNSVSWYNAESSACQLNRAQTYHWIAIG